MARASDLEVEVKLRIGGADAVTRRLDSLGYHVLRPRQFESNDIYDTVDGAFRRAGELVRIRRYGGENILTFKGAAIPGPHKSRPEFESRFENPAAIEPVFARAGLQRRFRYEKYRTEFARGSDPGIVTVDETPIGNFIELEGNPDWIDQTAAELGFERGAYVLESYGALYLSYCNQRGIPATNMTFLE